VNSELFINLGNLKLRLMQNDRMHVRRSVTVRGWIGSCQQDLLPCGLQDISAGGAMLVLPDGAEVPDTFRLYFSPTAPTFRVCKVRWRKPNSVGVQFAKAFSGVAQRVIE